MREIPFEPSLLDDPWMFGLPDSDEELDWVVLERIKDAVEDLPDDERAVVECLVWGQWTKTETAERLGRSRQSIHDLFRRAMDTLRAELEDLTP